MTFEESSAQTLGVDSAEEYSQTWVVEIQERESQTATPSTFDSETQSLVVRLSTHRGGWGDLEWLTLSWLLGASLS